MRVVKTDKGDGNDAARPQEGLPWLPDADAINRIISAVTNTPKGKKLAIDCDRNRLIADLLEARTKWLVFAVLDSDKGASARRKLFSVIERTAKDFKKRLLDDTGHKYAARAISSTFFSASDFDAFLDGLNRTIKAAETFVQQNSHGGWVRLSRSPKEWFVAEILPLVYERNFGRKARRSTAGSELANAGAAIGPYLRFAVSVMREVMGIEMSPETVARALKQVKAGARRRNPRETTLARRSRSDW